MKRKLFVVAITVLVLVLSSVSVAAAKTILDDDVNATEAVKAAQYQMEKSKSRMSGWSNAELGTPVTYYAPDNTKSAYEFTIMNGDDEVGFILVSARKDWMPVLEHSNGEAPSKHLEQAVEYAIERGYASKNDASKARLIYWGALSYSVQLGEKMKEEGTVIHLPTARIMPIPVMNKLQMEEQRVKAAWAKHSESIGDKISGTLSSIITGKPAMAAIDSRDPVTTYVPQTIDWVEISGVPMWYQHNDAYVALYGPCACCDEYSAQADNYPDCVGDDDDPWECWDGCSCIAGAMVCGYWALDNDDEELIDHCHHYMGTDSTGETDPWDIGDGIEGVFSEYSSSCSTSDVYPLVSWSSITDEVDAERPSVLSTGNIQLIPPSYSGHSQTVVGYEYDTGNPYYRKVWVHTTWSDPITAVIDFGNWDGAWLTRVIP